MKKIILFLFILLFSSFGTLAQETNEETISANAQINVIKKDPKLINIAKPKSVNKKAYEQKTLNDDKIYQSYKKNTSEEYFNLYLFLEKLLRANNLSYQNWRLAINKNIDEINASAGAINLISVNTSLYDSLYQNQNALAFVLSHELAHFLLGHHQISAEDHYKIQQLEARIQKLKYQSRRQADISSFNRSIHNNTMANSSAISQTGYTFEIIALQKQIKKIYAKQRFLELQADSEAVAIMTRGGFDAQKGEEALSFLSNMPNIYTSSSSHPPMDIRINNFNDEIKLVDLEELKKEGETNLYNSKVLELKQSSDKKTLVIAQASNSKKSTYVPQGRENKLLKRAYMHYINNDMDLAKTYFKDAFLINQSNYVPALYLSYIYENEFLNSNNKKSLKQAKGWAKKARQLDTKDKLALKQEEDITKLIKKIKEEKKKNEKDI